MIIGYIALAAIAMAILSAFLTPLFGIPGLFYAWLGTNALIGAAGIVLVVLQKEH